MVLNKRIGYHTWFSFLGYNRVCVCVFFCVGGNDGYQAYYLFKLGIALLLLTTIVKAEESDDRCSLFTTTYQV
ncbi:hypothetical protein K492DRAFT_56023 [Lichtheimia hyalospora FSU 10163]|nr:hypothetical protein K492DRAFT_56023 [Lichtheimia hyalospora FSU 10163]